MQKVIDMTGQRIGMLTVIERVEPAPRPRNAYWRCRCDCGKEIVATGSALRRGDNKSCGCTRRVSMELQYIKNDPDWKKSRKNQPCPYNEGCHCHKRECWKCGWNPKVAQARLEKIEQARKEALA
jgi:hypothetical protein